MNRSHFQRLATILVIVAGWIALVATSPPSSTIESEEFTGTVIVSPERPEVRVPFDLEFTQDEHDPGGSGMTIDVVHSWTDIAASRLPVTIQNPSGSVEVDSRYFVCRDCESSGELVIEWPWWETEGSVVVTWVASAALSYDTDTPPADASVAFEMDVPPIEIEESRIHPVEALDEPIQREELSLEGEPDPADHFRIAWPGWHVDPKEVPNSVLVRWGDQSATLVPGLAVEIPVTDLCIPDCEAELTYFLDREPSSFLGPWELIAPLTAAFVGGGTVEMSVNNIPVPSAKSAAIEREVTIPPDPGQEELVLTIVTDPIHDEIAPVARVSYVATAADSVAWVEYDRLTTRVGEHSAAYVDGEEPKDQDSTSVPLLCDQLECGAVVPIVFENELTEAASLLLDLDIEVFHADIVGHQVHASLTDPE